MDQRLLRGECCCDVCISESSVSKKDRKMDCIRSRLEVKISIRYLLPR